jgi:hypothetical protein
MGFVDDERNSINAFWDNPATMNDVAAKATKDCQLWHDLLWVVNQKLELTKCGYHEYEFLVTGEPRLINKPPVDLVLANG